MAGARTTVLVAVGAGVVATVIGIALAALGALTARWVRESVAVLRRHPDRLPGADHRDDDLGGVGRIALGRDLVGRHRVRRQHRPRHPARAAPCAAQRLRAGRPRLRPHARAEPRGATCCPTSRRCSSCSCRGRMAVAVLAEAGLSYLGFGAPVTEPSWGLLLAELQQFITVYPLSVRLARPRDHVHGARAQPARRRAARGDRPDAVARQGPPASARAARSGTSRRWSS